MEDMYRLLVRFFNNEEHIEHFRSGNLRTMSMEYYKKMEKQSLKLYDNRYDSIENSIYVLNPDKYGNIQLNNPINIGDTGYEKIEVRNCKLLNPIIIGNDKLDEITKILCFYMIDLNEIKDGKFNSVLSTMEDSFGDYYCLVTNTEEFIQRIAGTMAYYTKKNIIRNGEYKPVTYVDEKTYYGYYGPFCKPKGLWWQREFRIKFETLNKDPFIIKTKDIKDITICGKVRDLKNATINNNEMLVIENYNK